MSVLNDAPSAPTRLRAHAPSAPNIFTRLPRPIRALQLLRAYAPTRLPRPIRALQFLRAFRAQHYLRAFRALPRLIFSAPNILFVLWFSKLDQK